MQQKEQQRIENATEKISIAIQKSLKLLKNKIMNI